MAKWRRYEEQFYELLEEVYESKPELFPKDIQIRED
jgi:hypothetical protein